QWLAYTMVEPADTPTLKPGWLYDSGALFPARRGSFLPLDERPKTGFPRYRIWATERVSGVSVLIADAAYPLSSPAWDSDGHTLFYCRFVPRLPGTDPSRLRGQCELVVQESLDRQRVIMTLPDITLDRDQLATFCELKASWSPDGQYLAVPRPGRTAAILIVLPEQGRVLKTLDRASLPSWSPDSSRLTFVRTARDGSSTQTLQVIGHDFGAVRALADLSEMSEPASWSQDGQSVLVAAQRVQVRPQNFELLRVFIDAGVATRAMLLRDEGPFRESNRGRSPLRNPQPPENLDSNQMLTLGLDAPSPNAAQRFSLGFDRDQEQCIFSADLEGQIPVIGYSNIRRQTVLKKFHPIDISLRIGSLALHPDDQLAAVRIDTLGGSSPPLLCDLGSMNVKLVAPDDYTRQEWLTTLVATAHGLLQTVPQPSLDGQPVERVSLLPAPSEMLEQNPAMSRLHRIGKVARTLLDEPPVDQSSAGNDDSVGKPQGECRLFFDYLRGNYKDAEADLDVLASRAATPDLRFRLLALRAQVLHAWDMTHQARAIIDYLLKVQGGQTHRVEETPAGMVLTQVADPGRLWTRYLAQRLVDKSPAAKSSPGENEEGIDLRIPIPMDGFDGRVIDEGIHFPRRRPGLGGFGPGMAPGPGAGRMAGGPFGPGLQRPQRLFPPQPPQPAEPGGPFPRRFRRFDRPGQGPGQ
ncbi:MAG: PD40 domain-containing protein, partial [Planctomycetaceae bacterium]|nr:PD40 domain-containing protein [Planctomycetaceae bacterium]